MELLSIVTYTLGKNALKLEVLFVFIVLDVITGLIKAVINKEVQSGVMRTGLLKKVMEIITVIVGCVLDALMGTEYITISVLIFVIAMEGLSILENLGEYIALPDFLKSILENLKDQGNKGE